MLTQYRLFLAPQGPCRPGPEWGYRLYAALLEGAPGYAQALHRQDTTPLSQYLQSDGGRLCWSVTLLGRQSKQALGELLERQEEFYLKKERLCLRVERREKHSLSDVDQLLAQGMAPAHRLRFCTPAAFKSGGEYQRLPTSRLIIQNLMKRWNGCFPDCPIEDTDGQGMQALADGLYFRHFQLFDRVFFLKGNAIPGFAGTLELENRLNGFHRQLAGALLVFSGYAGIGIKTALGMGGVAHSAAD